MSIEGYITAGPLTISPSRASADSSVGGASLCRSISSNTKTKSPRVSAGRAARHSSRSTASVLTCSQRPFPYFSHSSFCPNASRVLQRILVRRWRAVMHSVLRTTACGTWSVESTPRTMVDLHVAETPWRTNVGGLGIRGCHKKKMQLISNLCPMKRHLERLRRSPWPPKATHMEKAGELARLDVTTRPLCAQGASNVDGLHESPVLGRQCCRVSWSMPFGSDCGRSLMEPGDHVFSRRDAEYEDEMQLNEAFRRIETRLSYYSTTNTISNKSVLFCGC